MSLRLISVWKELAALPLILSCWLLSLRWGDSAYRPLCWFGGHNWADQTRYGVEPICLTCSSKRANRETGPE